MTPMGFEKPFLKIEGLTLHYGAAQALFGVDLTVAKGETVAIVGANGAGKSSLLRAVSGLVPPSDGRILFAGQDVTGRPASHMAALGVALSPEGREMFGDLTVRESQTLGAMARRPGKAELLRRMEEVFDRFPRLRQRSDQRTGTLSGGEQQMVAIGRGLMAKPKLLMLDEPSLGLAPILIKSIFETVRKIADQGTTVLLVEQDVKHSLSLSDRGYVLEHGRIAMEGSAKDLLENPHIKTAYLGL